MEDILENGFYTNSHSQTTGLATNSDNFKMVTYYTRGTREMRMAIMYFFSLGYKPKKCKEEVKKLWKNYNDLSASDIRRLNGTIRYIRAHKDYDYHKLEDHDIMIDTGALKYFMDLKGRKLTEEQVEMLKKRRSDCLKNIKPKYFTNDRIKLLLTMYAWATKNCTDPEKIKRYNRCYTNRKWSKLKKASKIHTNPFNELCGFFDLGIVDQDCCFACWQAGKCVFQEGDPAKTRCMNKKDDAGIWILNFMDEIEYTGEYVKFDIDNIDEQMRHICPRCGRWFEPRSNNSTEVCLECKREENRLRVQKHRAAKKGV